MRTPKLVIFDMDGLIFDTERLFMKKKNLVLEEYGYPAREADYIQTIGLAGEHLQRKLIELYGEDYPADEITQKTRALVNIYMTEHGPDVKPGIRTLLGWLKEHRIPCCVASSTAHAYVRQYLKLAGLDTYFAYIIGGDEITRSKPDPDIFLAALQRSRSDLSGWTSDSESCPDAGISDVVSCPDAGISDPADALVLEDSENGIRAANAAGIPVVCIPDMKKPSAEVLAMTAAVLNSADELIALMQ